MQENKGDKMKQEKEVFKNIKIKESTHEEIQLLAFKEKKKLYRYVDEVLQKEIKKYVRGRKYGITKSKKGKV